jgi:hypothetical protein
MSALRCGKTSLSPWLSGLDLASDARTTVVDVSALTETSSERGLLGFDFSADGTKLYLDYTNLSASRDVELVEYDLAASPATRVLEKRSGATAYAIPGA